MLVLFQCESVDSFLDIFLVPKTLAIIIKVFIKISVDIDLPERSLPGVSDT